MNALSRTEFRPMSYRQAQTRLERMLANRRSAEAARAANDPFFSPDPVEAAA